MGAVFAASLTACGESTAPSAAGTATPAPTTSMTSAARATAVTVVTSSAPPGATSATAVVSVPPTTSIWPATTVVPDGPVDVEPVERIDPVDLTEPCPQVDSGVTPGAVGEEMAKLEPMLGAVLHYGGEHPVEFAGYGLVWHAAADASVVLAITGDLDAHRAAVAELVDHPDEVIVCQAAASAPVIDGIRAALDDEIGGRVTSLGGSWGVLDVGLAASAEDFAAELVDRYGAAVRLTVGALPYPLGDAPAQCRDLPAPAAGLEVTVDPAVATLGGDTYHDLTATITNTSNTDIEVSGTPTFVGTLVDDTGRVVSTVGDLAIGASFASNTLAPGESTTWDVVVGTASCDPALGYEVPTGEYGLVVELQGPSGSSTSPTIPFAVR